MRRSIACLASAVLLAGCATPSVPLGPTPVADAPQALPADFMVATNEPFWKATVQGESMLLVSPEGERRLRVVRNEALFDGRGVTARDADGEVELRITARLCFDSMSDGEYPYTARLAVGSAPAAMGCGRPL